MQALTSLKEERYGITPRKMIESKVEALKGKSNTFP